MARFIRIDKLLSDMGKGSRRDVKAAVKKGHVKVDRQVTRDFGLKVDPSKVVVEYLNETIEYREFVYILLNKPKGVVSATSDNLHKTVVDLVGDQYGAFDLFPVGRLDKDTEGLLLLTNDGGFAHNLLSPKKHVDKVYYAKIDGVVLEEDVEAFKNGIDIQDEYVTMPSILKILSVDHEASLSEVEVTIQEGKFHQVKRMFQAVGKQVMYLKRIKMGGLGLDLDMLEGEYRELTQEDLLKLQEK